MTDFPTLLYTWTCVIPILLIIPEAWKRYPFWAEPPRIGHYSFIGSTPLVQLMARPCCLQSLHIFGIKSKLRPENPGPSLSVHALEFNNGFWTCMKTIDCKQSLLCLNEYLQGKNLNKHTNTPALLVAFRSLQLVPLWSVLWIFQTKERLLTEF